MPAAADGVRALARLAADVTAARRRQVVSILDDLQRPAGGALSDRERAVIRDLLRKFARDVERGFRERLAARLGPSAPAEAAALLADPAVDLAAGPLLRGPLLEESALVRHAAEECRRHQLRLRLARLRDTSPGAASGVLERLLHDPDAAVAAAAAACARQASMRLDSFREPRLAPSDLDPATAPRIAALVAAAARAALLPRFPIDPEALDDALEAAMAGPEHGFERAAAPDAAAALARLLGAAGRISGDLLVQALRDGELDLLEALFGELSGLGPPRLGLMLYDPAGRGTAILCRALGIQRGTFASIFLLLTWQCETKVQDPCHLAGIMGFFDSVSREDALYVLRLWRRDPRFVAAVERLEEAESRSCA